MPFVSDMGMLRQLTQPLVSELPTIQPQRGTFRSPNA
jgi:hypothetical protein